MLLAAALSTVARDVGLATGIALGMFVVATLVALGAACVIAFEVGGFTVAVEGATATRAFAIALERVFARSWRRSLLAGLSLLAVQFGISLLAVAAGAVLYGFVRGVRSPALVVGAFASFALCAFTTMFVASYYYDVRVRTEGFDVAVEAERARAAASLDTEVTVPAGWDDPLVRDFRRTSANSCAATLSGARRSSRAAARTGALDRRSRAPAPRRLVRPPRRRRAALDARLGLGAARRASVIFLLQRFPSSPPTRARAKSASPCSRSFCRSGRRCPGSRRMPAPSRRRRGPIRLWSRRGGLRVAALRRAAGAGRRAADRRRRRRGAAAARRRRPGPEGPQRSPGPSCMNGRAGLPAAGLPCRATSSQARRSCDRWRRRLLVRAGRWPTGSSRRWRRGRARARPARPAERSARHRQARGRLRRLQRPVRRFAGRRHRHLLRSPNSRACSSCTSSTSSGGTRGRVAGPRRARQGNRRAARARGRPPAGRAVDAAARQALVTFMHRENLEDRVRADGSDHRQTLGYLRAAAAG